MLIKKLEKAGSLIDLTDAKIVKAGFVVLKEGEGVGEHVAKQKEEIIVILEGAAKVVCENEEEVVREQSVVYLPKNSKHNVINVGENLLKYVYITALLNAPNK